MRAVIRLTILLAVPIALGAMASCSSSRPESRAPSPGPSHPMLAAPEPAPPAAEPPAAAVQNAVRTYKGMWAAYDRAIGIPDPASPEIGRYAAGAALRTITTGLASVKQQGLKGTGAVTVHARPAEISPAAAPVKVAVRDCLDTSATHLVRARPGPPYRDSPGGRRECLATVERQGDGSWKVTSFALKAVGTC
jgi:hypothetical protein